MVLGWRRAFCSSIQKDKEKDLPIIKDKSDPGPSPKLTGFFSNPSTPRHSQPVSSPDLQCKTKIFHSSSPRSPSFIKSLRLSKEKQSRCGICLQSVKTGQGTAIFTAECGHTFHDLCIKVHIKKHGSSTCPICNSIWREMNLINKIDYELTKSLPIQKIDTDKRGVLLKVYNDDEPLSSPTSGLWFNPIPESDETADEEMFPGFSAPNNSKLEIGLLSEAAVVSVGKATESYAVVLRIKSSRAPLRRAPIDLVAVLNVSRSITSEKIHQMKRAMRLVLSSLSPADRLSVIAFSSTSKRLLPFRRMNTAGKRAARKIIDAVIAVDSEGATSAADSIKKAVKVFEDRRELNPVSKILIFSDGHRSHQLVSTTRFLNTDITIHSLNLSACVHASHENTIAKWVRLLVNFVIQDVRIQLGFSSGSNQGEVSAIYSYPGRPAFLGSGSSWCRIDDFIAEEEKELLIELKVPSSFSGSQHMLSVRCCYKDPSTHQLIHDEVRKLLIPRPQAGGTSMKEIQRLKCLFVTTRAVAESRKMSHRNELAGAKHMLASARALVLQSGSGSDLCSEFARRLESELAALNRTRDNHEREAEPLTPTSAWKAAEQLAKVAIMKKSLNRVGDLHGFEDARF